MRALSKEELLQAEFEAAFLKAIANPTRLKILMLLGRGEKSASAVVKAIGLTHAGIAQHMVLMANWGIVTKRRTKTNTFYSTNFAERDVFTHTAQAISRRQTQPVR
jgi:DNA-binding transcriptional ArsR family regulator